MRFNAFSFSIVGSLLAALIVGIFTIQWVFAQVDATLSDTVATSSTDIVPAANATTSTTIDTSTSTVTDTTTSTPTDTTPTTSIDAASTTLSVSVTPAESPPEGLTEVHIIGTKYTDYFTDGTTTMSYPGDPTVDGNLNKPNAPIPTHEGLTWVHTAGTYLYDTPSGDLDVGDYAIQSNGSIISAPLASSTSTPAVLGASTSASDTTSTSSDQSDHGIPITDSSITTTP